MQSANAPKQPFKPQAWMFGALVLPFGLFMIGRGILKTNSVELGGECGQRDECKPPADACLSVEGKSVCTKYCSAGKCPSGLSCVTIDVSMNTGVGTTNLPDQQYCLPAAMAKP